MAEKLTNNELFRKYAGRITDPLKLIEVKDVCQPHPFMVGPAHITYASQHGGTLNERAMEAAPCYNCRKPLSEHENLKILAVEVTRACTQAEVKAVLVPELGDDMEKDKIDGVAFPVGYGLITKTG